MQNRITILSVSCDVGVVAAAAAATTYSLVVYMTIFDAICELPVWPRTRRVYGKQFIAWQIDIIYLFDFDSFHIPSCLFLRFTSLIIIIQSNRIYTHV